MSPVVILNWQRGLLDSALPLSAKLVGIAISLRINGSSGECHPRVAVTCQDTRLRERTVQMGLSALGRAGFLNITARPGQLNHYRLTSPAQDEDAQEPLSSVTPPPADTPEPDPLEEAQDEATPAPPCTPDTQEPPHVHAPPPACTCTPPPHVHAPRKNKENEQKERVDAPVAGAPVRSHHETAHADGKKPRKTPQRIGQDWTPNPDSMAWLAAHGVTQDEALPIVTEFRCWALGTEKKAANWDFAFRRNPPVKNAIHRLKLDRERRTAPPPLAPAIGPAYRTTIRDIDALLA